MKRISTKIRVWKILLAAMHDNLDVRQKTGYIIIEGQTIPTPEGYVPNWVFASIPLCGSTSGIRYLRQGRGFLPEQYNNQYDFQKKKIGHTWHYRINIKKQGYVLPYVNFEIIDPPNTHLEDVAFFEKRLYRKLGISVSSMKKSKLKIKFAGSGV